MVNFQGGVGVLVSAPELLQNTIIASALLLITTTYASALQTSGPCRDRFVWPFSNESVWNMPLGSNATYRDAHVYNVSRDAGCALRSGPAVALRTVCAGWNASWSPATCLSAGCCYSPISPDPRDIPWCHRPGGMAPQWGFHNDADLIVATSSDDPLVPWISQGNWNSGNHCTVTGPQATVVPLPKSFTTPCGGGNNAMALLLPNNCTLIQMQPAFRLDASSPLLALYHEGGPVPFPWNISIMGEGATGAHGGSGLSSIGGTIRSGELRPNAPPLAHVLKLELLAHDYYFSNGSAAPYNLVRWEGRVGGEASRARLFGGTVLPVQCFRWPALGCDGYAHDDASPLVYNGTVPGLQPGTLLAIPSERSVVVATVPGGRIRDALATFGG